MTTPIAYTIPEAASVSRIGRTLLYDAIKNGKLVARKWGRRTLIEDAELRRFIASLPAMNADRAA